MIRKLLITLFMLTICISCKTVVKSKSEITDFHVEVKKHEHTGLILCKLTGKSIDSALWIENYNIEYNNVDVYVIIERSLKQTGISGPYYIQFIIPESTDRVFLGREELIWKR